MANFILIFLCLTLGYLIRRSGRLPSSAPQVLNAFVIHVSLPGVILVQIPALLKNTHFDSHMWIPVSMAWVQLGLAFLWIPLVGRFFGFGRTVIGALILTAGLGNTSFVGIPLLEALHGPAAVQIAILCDQLGSFLALSVVGVLIALKFTGREGEAPTWGKRLRTIAFFPPFVALIVAVLWSFTGTTDHPVAVAVLEKLAGTLVPLALIAVGLQLRFSPAVLGRIWRPLTLGLIFKLVLSPLIFVGLYRVLLGSREFSTDMTILESAMAPMITAAVVAEEFGLDKDTANLMVGLGVPLSLVTVPLWNALLM